MLLAGEAQAVATAFASLLFVSAASAGSASSECDPPSPPSSSSILQLSSVQLFHDRPPKLFSDSAAAMSKSSGFTSQSLPLSAVRSLQC